MASRGRVVTDWFLLIGSVLCFLATAMVIQVIYFMFARALLGPIDLGLLISLGLCFCLLGCVAVLAIRARRRGESAYSRRIVIPALVVGWLVVLVSLLGRIHIGDPFDHVFALAALVAVVLACVSFRTWHQFRSADPPLKTGELP